MPDVIRLHVRMPPGQRFPSGTESDDIDSGRARFHPSRQRLSRLTRRFALPGPAEAIAAHQEVRPPGRARRAVNSGRARFHPSRQRLLRLTRRFALPGRDAASTPGGLALPDSPKAIETMFPRAFLRPSC